MPWGMKFPRGSPPTTARALEQAFHVRVSAGTPPDQVLAVHPTQLYEVALAFVIFWYLWRSRENRHAAGWLFGLYLVLTGAARIFAELFRAKDDRFFGPFTLAQVLSFTVAVLGGWLMMAYRAPETTPPATSP